MSSIEWKVKFKDRDNFFSIFLRSSCLKGNKTVRHPLKKTVRHQDISAPVEKDSSAPRHFGTVEKKCQIGIAISFKQT